MPHINVRDACNQLPALIERARRGEEVVLTDDDRPLARLVATSSENTPRQPGSAKGLIQMSDDFDEPLEDFQAYR